MEFEELFKIQYQGYPEELQEIIQSIVGIEDVSIDAPFERVQVDKQLDCNISYNAYSTDRTRICNQLEKHENIDEVIHG